MPLPKNNVQNNIDQDLKVKNIGTINPASMRDVLSRLRDLWRSSNAVPALEDSAEARKLLRRQIPYWHRPALAEERLNAHTP